METSRRVTIGMRTPLTPLTRHFIFLLRIRTLCASVCEHVGFFYVLFRCVAASFFFRRYLVVSFEKTNSRRKKEEKNVIAFVDEQY